MPAVHRLVPFADSIHSIRRPSITQNLLSLTFSEAELAEIDGALAVLERHFAPLPELTPDERRQLTKMGDKSEAFCRQTLVVLAQHPEVLPPNFDLTEAQNDLKQLDQLRPRLHRLERLQGKGWDADTALGSDVMSACLDGYALLKVTGKSAGLGAVCAVALSRTRVPPA